MQPAAGSVWGLPENFGSAAYWRYQARAWPDSGDHRLGSTLVEEVAACILGGHGLPAEVGLAAFRAVRDAGLLSGDHLPSHEPFEEVLTRPLRVARGRLVHYRFPRQRARRLAGALGRICEVDEALSGPAMRDNLLRLPGVGPKTASWITRNRTASPEVAIIDVHVHRAGVAAGFLRDGCQLPRDYLLLERDFLAFAEAAQVPAPRLDACIWAQMHELGIHGPRLLEAARQTRLMDAARVAVTAL